MNILSAANVGPAKQPARPEPFVTPTKPSEPGGSSERLLDKFERTPGVKKAARTVALAAAAVTTAALIATAGVPAAIGAGVAAVVGGVVVRTGRFFSEVFNYRGAGTGTAQGAVAAAVVGAGVGALMSTTVAAVAGTALLGTLVVGGGLAAYSIGNQLFNPF